VRQVTDALPDPVHDVPGTSPTSAADEVDLDTVERDLAAVEVALERLDDGSYWTDEVTGAPIPEHVLAADPTARRA
jgi:RNA polymerase-binding transcription factor DksA